MRIIKVSREQAGLKPLKVVKVKTKKKKKRKKKVKRKNHRKRKIRDNFTGCSQEQLEVYANRLRIEATNSELTLKMNLSELTDYHFIFQSILHGYIADFHFPRFDKIVELDGQYHNKKKDRQRDHNLQLKGIQTLRIPSQRVFTNLDSVLFRIDRFLLGKDSVIEKKQPVPKWISPTEEESYKQFLMKVAE